MELTSDVELLRLWSRWLFGEFMAGCCGVFDRDWSCYIRNGQI